jgi:hypothetical protein
VLAPGEAGIPAFDVSPRRICADLKRPGNKSWQGTVSVVHSQDWSVLQNKSHGDWPRELNSNQQPPAS